MLGGFLEGHRKSLNHSQQPAHFEDMHTNLISLTFSAQSCDKLGLLKTLPVLRCICQRDHNILVDEDEEGQEEAEPHSTDNVHG